MASETIERELYNGRFKLEHNPDARGRTPRYLVNGQVKPKGVTTIIGSTLAKDLVDWAVKACCDYLQAKLPVVTEEDLKVSADEYKRLRDAGAGTGSEAHKLVEDFLKDKKITNTDISEEAQNAFGAFQTWFESAKPEVINVEEVIYSERFGYAGTYDCMLRIDGKVYLCDLKTTNPSRKAPKGVYAENFIQLGAYALAHEEQRQYEEENGGTKLVPIDGLMVISAKKNGVLDTVSAEELGLTVEACGQMFHKVMNLFQFMDYTTKSLGGK